MSDLNTKMVEAVSRLIELTQDDRIKWAESTVPSRLSEDANVFIEAVFCTETAGRHLRLYERETRKYVNPLFGAITFSENPLWEKRVVLEIVDLTERVLWTFPNVTPLSDLLETVRFQVADVSDFIRALSSSD